MVQRREKEKDLRYIQEASAPAAVTVYQTCNIMYICNKTKRLFIDRTANPATHRHVSLQLILLMTKKIRIKEKLIVIILQTVFFLRSSRRRMCTGFQM